MKKYKYILCFSILFIFLCIIGTTLINNDQNLVEAIEIKEEQKVENTKIKVDIKGAVNNPGVYELDSLSRVKDVIDLAGGLKKEADTANINLSKIVKDEMVIIISTKNELKQEIINVEKTSVANDASIQKSEVIPSLNKQSEDNTTSTLVNINSATLEELMTLNGIGASKAQAIIDYRNTNGNFSSIEDIKNVTGIGESAYSKIKEYITI